MASRLLLAPEMMEPLVSVIMPTRDRPALLCEAIRSVLAQSHQRLEIVVVNDGGAEVESTLCELDPQRRIVSVRLPISRGAAAARNAALRLARGELIAYLDDDDTWDPHHLATLLAALGEGRHALAYSDARRRVEVRDGAGYRVEGVQEPYYSRDFSRDAFLVDNYIPILCILHRRTLYQELGGFEESLAVLEDWELWLRYSRKHDFLHVPTVTATVRWRTDGSSTTVGKRRDHLPIAAQIHARYPSDDRAICAARNQLLAALAQQAAASGPPRCSILFEGDEQRMAAIAAVTRGPTFELVRVERGESLNRVVRRSSGRYLAFLRPELSPCEGWLEALVAELERAPAASASAETASLDGPTCLRRRTLEQLGGFERALGMRPAIADFFERACAAGGEIVRTPHRCSL